MDRIDKRWIICLVLLIITSMISVTLFVYDSKELSSGYIPKGMEKKVDDKSVNGSFMLSYGPDHKLRDEYYIIMLSYETDADSNSYSIYSDTTSTLYEGNLDKDATKVTYWLKNPNISVQVLTFYSGVGALQIDNVKVIPLKIVMLWFVSLFSIFGGIFAKGKVGNILKKIMEFTTCLFVLSTTFYVDDSAAIQNKGMLLSLLFLIAIIAMFCLAWEKIGYKEGIFVLAFSACWITEWKNVVNYNLDYMILFLSGAIASCIFSICYMFIKNARKYYIVTTCISSLFILYSTIQYVYYTYFKDFFTIKIVRLLFTAMEASSSIKELIDKNALSYLGIGGGYIILVVFVVIQWKKFQQRNIKRQV